MKEPKTIHRSYGGEPLCGQKSKQPLKMVEREEQLQHLTLKDGRTCRKCNHIWGLLETQ